MKFSLVNGERRAAEKGLAGICIGCGQPTIPKCGSIRVKHWAHKSQCECDHWWENETDWHRGWKNKFPVECQEIRLQSESGEWHFADVKTQQGWVLEFQNSPISPEERESRNLFYRTIVWIVNGSRLKRDKPKFLNALEDGTIICNDPQVTRVSSSDCSLIKKWSNCRAPVFFDLGDDSLLGCLFPASQGTWHFVAPIRREDFVDCHQGGETQLQRFICFLQAFDKVISTYASHAQRQQEFYARRQFLARSPIGMRRHYTRRPRRFRF